MNQKNFMLILLTFIFLGTSLYAHDYRVSVAIKLDPEEVKALKQKQSVIKDFIKNNLYKTYKNILNPIFNNLETQGFGRSGWPLLNKADNDKPVHITLAYIDDHLDQKDLAHFKQVLERVAQQIVIQFPNGLGDFSIHGDPTFIGDKGWVAYENISDHYGNLEKMAQILSESLQTDTPQSINKDHPIFKPHISIGMLGNNSYLPKNSLEKKRVFLGENPFYLQLLQQEALLPNKANSVLAWIKKKIVVYGKLDNPIKFSIKNFILTMYDITENRSLPEQIYELPSGLAAQLALLKNKLEHLKSKLLLLKNQLKALKTQLAQ